MTCWMTFWVTTTPALAIPKPRAEEWWFGLWEIQRKVWPIAQGQGVVVAVLDSGVNARLPDLKGVVLPGGDTIGGGTDGLTDHDAGRGHGTAMAMLIAGQGHGTRMVGVAPWARVLPVRANNDTNGTAAPEAMAKAIRYAVDHGAKVINMSLATRSESELECEPPRQEAIDYAISRDVVIVAGTGNEGNKDNLPMQPAACPGVLAVGAVDHKQKPAWFTQRHPYVAVAAPGVSVGSTGKEGRFDPDVNGTSSATALTSGVVALVRSKFPKMPAREVVRRITATARDVGPRGHDNQTGYGIVNPHRALAGQVPATAPNPVFDRWDQSRRERAINPPRTRQPEVIPEPYLLRDKLLHAALALGGLAALGAGVTVPLVLARRRRSRGRTASGASRPWSPSDGSKWGNPHA
jgi:type VII secretion-associated serine protease mycosin